MSEATPTREDLIYLWKVEGGNLSWARWCKIHNIPERNEAYHDELKRVAVEGSKIIEKSLARNPQPDTLAVNNKQYEQT